MRDEGLCARKRTPFKATTDSKHRNPIAPNLLDRQFTTTGPNVAWVGDVTAILTMEGWLFLAVRIDLDSRRRRVGRWSTSEHNDTNLALAALHNARRSRRPGPGLLHHTDRAGSGRPYASDADQKALTAIGARASMSRKGNCWDNAVAESFFSSTKTELGVDKPLASFAQANSMATEYIDVFYNAVRLHSTNGYMSPIQFELTSITASLAA